MKYHVVLLLLLLLLLRDGMASDAVERVWAPTDSQECDAAWQRNNDAAERLVETVNICRDKCADENVAAIGTNSYGKVCGGELSYHEEFAIAGFRRCERDQKRLNDFYTEKKNAYDDCLRAVDNVRAAKFVYDASKDDHNYPRQIAPVRSAVEEAHGRVQTGNVVVDAYRDEVAERTINATSTILEDGMDEVEQQSGHASRSGSKSAYSNCKTVPVSQREACIYKNLQMQKAE